MVFYFLYSSWLSLIAQGKPPVTSTDFESGPGDSPTNNNESPVEKISNQYTEGNLTFDFTFTLIRVLVWFFFIVYANAEKTY